MFKRKILVVALLAVVLLSSFMEGNASVDRRFKHKRTAGGDIVIVDQSLSQASSTNLQNRMAGSIAGIDPNNRS